MGTNVAPADPVALRSAIVRLLDDADETARLGSNARQWVVERADIAVYAAFLTGVVDEVRTR